MPEAAVDKNHFPAFAKYKVRLSGHIFLMQPKAVPHLVNRGANDQFRLGVLAFDQPHTDAAFYWCETVGHESALAT